MKIDQGLVALERFKSAKKKYEAASVRPEGCSLYVAHCYDPKINIEYQDAGWDLNEIADHFFEKLTAFKSLEACLKAQNNYGYRPTFHDDNAELSFLADIYDIHAEIRGLPLSYRPKRAI
jgi:hypothetical protein